MATSTIIEPNYLSKHFLNKVKNKYDFFDENVFLSSFVALSKREQIDLVYTYMEKHNVFTNWTADMKDNITASNHRIKGNTYYKNGNYLKALEEYNHALTLTNNETNLALLYANRSACFYKLGMRKPCLEEINRALIHNYPKNLGWKLNRRSEAAEKLSNIKENYHQDIPKIPYEHKNSKIQCASNGVEIAHSEEIGTHVVAARDIHIGEVIAVEKPYACVAFTDERLYHCHYCLRLCYNMIPCESCTQAMFCGEQCKERANQSYHVDECMTLKTVNTLNKRNTMLTIALRTALLQAKENRPDDNGLYRSDRYAEISRLDLKTKLMPADLLHEAVLTSMVFRLIKRHSQLFQDASNDDAELKQSIFKLVLFQQLLSAKSNASKIYEYVHNNTMHETINFGFGIYSFFSLFRHSCAAHIMKCYCGTKMVLRAINTIRKGEECFVNRYGLRYGVFTRPVRDDMLIISRLPKCQCIACRENWDSDLGDLNQICVRLGIVPTTFVDMVKRVIGKDLIAAVKYLPLLIEMLKECEDSEPRGNALTLKRLIVHCFVIFGNKRIL